MKDFVSWIEDQTKGSPTPLADALGTAKVDTPGTLNPLTLKQARDFYTSLGEAIPWEEYGGKGGRMFKLAKDMRSPIGQAISDALPYGTKYYYQKALADYAKAAKWSKMAGPAGWIGGKVAGWGLTGHYAG